MHVCPYVRAMMMSWFAMLLGLHLLFWLLFCFQYDYGMQHDYGMQPDYYGMQPDVPDPDNMKL